jgi:hypothetical protein
MKRILTALCAFLLVCGVAFAEPREPGQALTVHTFTFKYKQADKAAAAIKTLLSGEGTMSIQPSTNALVVTDHPENVKAIVKALAEFDSAAQPYRLSVRIVAASRAATASRIPAELNDVAESLRVFRQYNSFERVGDANVQGKEGDPGLVDMPTGYRADFKFGEYDPASDSIKINDLQISKVQKDQLTSLFKTSLNLRLGQTYIFGAARAPQSQRALMIVLVARR